MVHPKYETFDHLTWVFCNVVCHLHIWNREAMVYHFHDDFPNRTYLTDSENPPGLFSLSRTKKAPWGHESSLKLFSAFTLDIFPWYQLNICNNLKQNYKLNKINKAKTQKHERKCVDYNLIEEENMMMHDLEKCKNFDQSC